MNTTQRVIVASSVLCGIFMGAFPPWKQVNRIHIGTISDSSEHPVGYAFIGTPPIGRAERAIMGNMGAGISIDVTRLAIQYAVLALTSSGMIVLLKLRVTNTRLDQESPPSECSVLPPPHDGLCRAEAAPIAKRMLKGKPPALGGWLAVPALGLVCNIAWSCMAVAAGPSKCQEIFAIGLQIPSRVVQADPLAVRTAIWTMILAHLMLTIVTAIHFARRTRTAPQIMQFWLAVGLVTEVILVLNAGFVFGLEVQWSAICFAAAWRAVWYMYFSLSERVRYTFIGDAGFESVGRFVRAVLLLWLSTVGILVLLVAVDGARSLTTPSAASASPAPTTSVHLPVARARPSAISAPVLNTTAVPALGTTPATDIPDDLIPEPLAIEFCGRLADERKRREYYEQNVTEIIGDGLVQPGHLDAADKIAIARVKLRRIQELLDAAESHASSINEMSQRIGPLRRATEPTRTGLRAFQERVQNTIASIHEWYAAERALTAEAGRLVDFTATRLGRCQIVAGKVYFAEQSDVDQYNAILNHISRCADRKIQATRRVRELTAAAERELANIDREVPPK